MEQSGPVRFPRAKLYPSLNKCRQPRLGLERLFGVGLDQLLEDGQARVESGERLRESRLAGLRSADVVLAPAQPILDIGVGGVGVDQFLVNGQRFAVRRQRLCRLPGAR